MIIFTGEDHGKLVRFYWGTQGPYEGAICIPGDGRIYICNNDGIHSANPQDKLGYKYAVRIQFELDNRVEYSDANRVEFINKVEALFKKSPSGTLFRRIYKQEGKLIYVGSIQKDLEDTKLPSSLVQIMDMDYLKASGWNEYKKEPSAEEKLSRQNRQSVPGLNA